MKFDKIIISMILILSLQCDESVGPTEQNKSNISISEIFGDFIPSEAKIAQFDKAGNLISEQNIDIAAFLLQWNTSKYLRITQDSSFTYTLSGNCIYIMKSAIKIQNDTCYLQTRMHDSERNATEEYIVPIDSGFQIVSKYDTNDIQVTLKWTTKLRKIDYNLPVLSWDTISCKVNQ